MCGKKRAIEEKGGWETSVDSVGREIMAWKWRWTAVPTPPSRKVKRYHKMGAAAAQQQERGGATFLQAK